jgi:phytoene synthase
MDFATHENFPVALPFLPRMMREDFLSIYGYARLVDQIGDAASGDRMGLLDELELDLDQAFSGAPSHPLLRRLSRTIRRHRIPRDPFARLIEANRLDQTLRQISTSEELHAYCALSAMPIGELVLRVCGQWNVENAKWSDAVCSALQIVEHCQDVAEDFESGRIYLPKQDLEELGCPIDALNISPARPELRRVVHRQVEWARELLSDATPLVARLRGWARPAVAAFAGGGLATCDALEAAQFDPNSTPIRPRKWRLVVNTLGLMVRQRRPS